MKYTILATTSLAGIVLAAPFPQYNAPWPEFFGPEPNSSPYPYYPQPQVLGGGGGGGQLPVPPSGLPASLGLYGQPYGDPGAPLPPTDPTPLPPPAPGPLDTPEDQRRMSSILPSIPKPKLSKPVSEKPYDKKGLAEKLATEFEEKPVEKKPAAAAAPQPSRSESVAKPVVKETDSKEGEFDKDAIRYHVNVGGVQKGGNGGTTNFHVFSDENGNKRFSDELDDETEKYINENMIPKLGGKRKGKSTGGVWSVFGDN